MTYLFYLILLIVPLVTYSKSTDPFGIKTLLVMILGFLCLLDYRQPRKYYRPDVAYLFFGWVAISYLYTPWKLGNPGVELLLMIAYMGIYVYARDHIFTAKVVPVLLVSLALTIGYNLYLNHLSWLTIKEMFGLHRTVWNASTFVNVRIYSGWLVLLIPIALSRALQGKVSGWILFAAGLFALWTSGGRSSMLGLTAGLAAFSAFYWGKRAWIPILIIIGLFGFIGWNSFSHNIIDPSRAHFWSGVIPQIQAHPIIGTGVGSFRVEYPKYKENVQEGANPQHLLENCHNEFFQILTETGIIGLCLFLWLIYKTFKRADKSNILNIAMISGVFGSLCDNFYNISLRYSAVAMLFWVYLGLLASNTKREEPKHEGWLARLSEWGDYCFFN